MAQRESVRTDAAGIAQAIQNALDDYGEAVSAQLPTLVKETAKECVSEIKANAPRRSGRYRAGWTSKLTTKTGTSAGAVVYNKDRYRLTHLLENGHAKISGGRVEGHPHIAPAAENAADKLVKRMKEAAKNA